MDSLIHLGFELKQAVEKEQRANLLTSEIELLEKSISPLIPLIEQQTEFENKQQELLQRQASVKSMLEKTRKTLNLLERMVSVRFLTGSNAPQSMTLPGISMMR